MDVKRRASQRGGGQCKRSGTVVEEVYDGGECTTIPLITGIKMMSKQYSQSEIGGEKPRTHHN